MCMPVVCCLLIGCIVSLARHYTNFIEQAITMVIHEDLICTRMAMLHLVPHISKWSVHNCMHIIKH